ncbi:hypothetical protein N9L49_01040 [Rhodospirillales bacterium]|nr:hypothetical protein [Rhodospirillales bacterium]
MIDRTAGPGIGFGDNRFRMLVRNRGSKRLIRHDFGRIPAVIYVNCGRRLKPPGAVRYGTAPLARHVLDDFDHSKA